MTFFAARPGAIHALQRALIALFLPAVVLSALNNILLINSRELILGLRDFVIIAAALTAAAMVLYCAAGALRKRAAGRHLLRLAAMVGAMALVSNVSKAYLAAQPFSVVLACDAAATIAIGVGLYAIPLRPLAAIVCAAALVLIPTEAHRHFRLATAALDSHERLQKAMAPKRQTAAQSTAAPKAGNVYHIILDSFQSDAFDDLAKHGRPDAIREFAYFPEFRTNYGRTHFSVPSIFLSEFYDGRDEIEFWLFQKMRSQGMLRALHDANVALVQFPYYTHHCPEFANYCYSPIHEVRKRQSLRTLIDLSFVSLVPASVQRLLEGDLEPLVAVRAGEELHLPFSITDVLTGEPSYVSQSFHPYFSVSAFRALIDGVPELPPSGQYVFLHAILPHGPYLFDAQCEYVPERADVRPGQVVAAYLEQGRCALRLVRQLVERLKALGRYDNALIVVHSDHGHRLVRLPGGDLVSEEHAMAQGAVRRFRWQTMPANEWPEQVLEGAARGLLLVKFPGNRVRGTVDAAAQAIDIAPTILDHFGLPTERYGGRKLQSLHDAPSRAPIFFTNNELRHHTIPDRLSKYVRKDDRWLYTNDIEVAFDR